MWSALNGAGSGPPLPTMTEFGAASARASVSSSRTAWRRLSRLVMGLVIWMKFMPELSATPSAGGWPVVLLT
ncbi:MAG: hypothetical protein NTZ79_09295 [Proteobacteria bacterium]|nr:hypothetical protein [Pseudomonadota bacterium]